MIDAKKDNVPIPDAAAKSTEKILHATTLSQLQEKILNEIKTVRGGVLTSEERLAISEMTAIAWDTTAKCRTYEGALKKMHHWVNEQSARKISQEAAIGRATTFLDCLDILFLHSIDNDSADEYIKRIFYLMPTRFYNSGQKLISKALRTFLAKNE